MDARDPHRSFDHSRCSAGALNAPQLSVAMGEVWLAVDMALSPILGRRGVAALYDRSLHLSAATHSWLVGAQQESDSVLDTAPLQSVLAQQSDANAAAGARAVLENFQELLASLVGASLTGRLLRSVWTAFPDPLPSQASPA